MMEGYVVSLNDNVLTVSLLGSEEVFELELSKDIASGGRVHDDEQFAENLGNMILENFGEERKKLPLHFLISPDEAILNFVTISKKDKESEETKLQEELSKKLAATALTTDDVYASIPKIAPFVHQLVAVKREDLDRYLHIGELIGFDVQTVVPWVLLLPRFLPNPVAPKIFILRTSGREVLVLSELGGVYFVDEFKEKKGSDLKKIIKELSVYERNEPISNIYVFGTKSFDMGGDYKVSELEIKSLHDLYSPGMAGDVLNSYANLLSLLPVPEGQKSKMPVYVGIGVAALLLVLGIVYARGNFNGPQAPAGPTSELQEGLETTESTPAREESQQTEEQVELNRAYLKVRVENGTNVGGLAGRTRDHLATFGYEIVSIGDAEASDTETTIIRFSPENAIYKDLLSTDLKEMYTEVQVQEDLSSDLEYDVLVIAGTNEK